jgi:hypothetical protein
MIRKNGVLLRDRNQLAGNEAFLQPYPKGWLNNGVGSRFNQLLMPQPGKTGNGQRSKQNSDNSQQQETQQYVDDNRRVGRGGLRLCPGGTGCQ